MYVGRAAADAAEPGLSGQRAACETSTCTLVLSSCMSHAGHGALLGWDASAESVEEVSSNSITVSKAADVDNKMAGSLMPLHRTCIYMETPAEVTNSFGVLQGSLLPKNEPAQCYFVVGFVDQDLHKFTNYPMWKP